MATIQQGLLFELNVINPKASSTITSTTMQNSLGIAYTLETGSSTKQRSPCSHRTFILNSQTVISING